MKYLIKKFNTTILAFLESKNSKEDLKDFFVTTLGIVMSSFFSYLATKEINSVLSVEEFGKFSYFFSIFQLLFVLFSLGFYNSYLRFNVDGELTKLVTVVRNFTILSTLIFALVIFYFTRSVLTVSFAFILIYYERTYYFRSLKMLFNLNTLLILTSLLNYISLKLLNYLSVSIKSDTVIEIYGFSYMLSVFFLFYKPKKIKSNNSNLDFTLVIKYSFPLIGVTFVDWLLNYCNQIIVKDILGTTDLAHYSMAFRSLFVFKFIASVFLMFYPTIYFRDINNGNFKNIYFFRFIIISILFLTAGLMFFNSNLVYLIMGGEKYLQTSYLFKILLLGDFIRIVASFFGLVFTYQIKTYLNLSIQVIASILNIFFCFYLISHYGIIGAALGNFIACSFIFISTIILAKNIEKKLGYE